MKTIRSISKMGLPNPFMEFHGNDVYWTNMHIIIKNDSDLIKSIDKIEEPITKEHKEYQNHFFFQLSSKGFNGLITNPNSIQKGQLKNFLDFKIPKAKQLKEINIPTNTDLWDYGIDFGLISGNVGVGVNKDYHDYLKSRVKGGPDKIITGNSLYYIKDGAPYAALGMLREFFDNEFNNHPQINSETDFVRHLYGEEDYKDYIYDFK